MTGNCDILKRVMDLCIEVQIAGNARKRLEAEAWGPVAWGKREGYHGGDVYLTRWTGLCRVCGRFGVLCCLRASESLEDMGRRILPQWEWAYDLNSSAARCFSYPSFGPQCFGWGPVAKHRRPVSDFEPQKGAWMTYWMTCKRIAQKLFFMLCLPNDFVTFVPFCSMRLCAWNAIVSCKICGERSSSCFEPFLFAEFVRKKGLDADEACQSHKPAEDMY